MSDSNDGLAVVGSLLLTGAIFGAALNVWGGLMVGAGYLIYVAAGLAVWRAGRLSVSEGNGNTIAEGGATIDGTTISRSTHSGLAKTSLVEAETEITYRVVSG